jgi:hypothetical protein
MKVSRYPGVCAQDEILTFRIWEVSKASFILVSVADRSQSKYYAASSSRCSRSLCGVLMFAHFQYTCIFHRYSGSLETCDIEALFFQVLWCYETSCAEGWRPDGFRVQDSNAFIMPRC